MLVFDTNVLIYAVEEDSPFHAPCRNRTRDSDFRRFPFLTVVDPLRESRNRLKRDPLA